MTAAFHCANGPLLIIKLNLLVDFGSGGRDRTYDQLINSQLLYR